MRACSNGYAMLCKATARLRLPGPAALFEMHFLPCWRHRTRRSEKRETELSKDGDSLPLFAFLQPLQKSMFACWLSPASLSHKISHQLMQEGALKERITDAVGWAALSPSMPSRMFAEEAVKSKPCLMWRGARRLCIICHWTSCSKSESSKFVALTKGQTRQPRLASDGSPWHGRARGNKKSSQRLERLVYLQSPRELRP